MINLDKENLYKEIKNLGETTYADWVEQRLSCKKIIALSKPFFTENENKKDYPVCKSICLSDSPFFFVVTKKRVRMPHFVTFFCF